MENYPRLPLLAPAPSCAGGFPLSGPGAREVDNRPAPGPTPAAGAPHPRPGSPSRRGGTAGRRPSSRLQSRGAAGGGGGAEGGAWPRGRLPVRGPRPRGGAGLIRAAARPVRAIGSAGPFAAASPRRLAYSVPSLRR